ncbi:bactofilin family protein [Desulfovibrio aminophilus]|uniref:bactofilin family protein n=1 Tax=Desulfovibrio aminophilus TaxID=81425 RepID=UPI000416C99F|nr:polymer-forming cytoskeletal protein [Desulfovibrio aminophilus]
MAKDEINAFLGAGTSYHGKLHFHGAVRIDGNFQGEVESDGTLVIGQEAVVEGTLRVGQLVLSGNLRGEVEAGGRVVLHKTANLQGDIRTPVLVVEEGAILEGRLAMSRPGEVADAVGTADGNLF